ncbi:hypothetical protein BDK51DRAFT_26074 [Blyttiomyces helicus]|uniref:Uncharacterized protein n=1 Tax=Blyttiomyces helicus TaxID=388810 RepID=A0A4P9W9S5_9FUNG|nr:hypothetical protein BDK51DRAFT_26074 [Blyttiomyces helicus]|eukprot:RKO89164.1 hypothetical protein BDK51DRAFT_26074 [Blyttiomyces helicus]
MPRIWGNCRGLVLAIILLHPPVYKPPREKFKAAKARKPFSVHFKKVHFIRKVKLGPGVVKEPRIVPAVQERAKRETPHAHEPLCAPPVGRTIILPNLCRGGGWWAYHEPFSAQPESLAVHIKANPDTPLLHFVRISHGLDEPQWIRGVSLHRRLQKMGQKSESQHPPHKCISRINNHNKSDSYTLELKSDPNKKMCETLRYACPSAGQLRAEFGASYSLLTGSCCLEMLLHLHENGDLIVDEVLAIHKRGVKVHL